MNQRKYHCIIRWPIKRPAVEAFSVEKEEYIDCFIQTNTSITNLLINDTAEPPPALEPKTDYTPSSFINTGGSSIDFTKAYNLIQQSKKEKGEIMAARIVGVYENIATYLLINIGGEKESQWKSHRH